MSSPRIRFAKDGKSALAPQAAVSAFYVSWRAEHSPRARQWPLAEVWAAFERFAEQNPYWRGYPGRTVGVNDTWLTGWMLEELVDEQRALADPRSWIDSDDDGGERRNAQELRDEAIAVLTEWKAARAA